MFEPATTFRGAHRRRCRTHPDSENHRRTLGSGRRVPLRQRSRCLAVVDSWSRGMVSSSSYVGLAAGITGTRSVQVRGKTK